MASTETWTLIHEARASLVANAKSFSDDQWAATSWCEGWSNKQVLGHIVAAAEQTTFGFYKDLIASGFSFTRYANTGAQRNARDSAAELLSRLSLRTTTTNHPPAPVIAMLGEIVVHSDDIYRPLGMSVPGNPDALRAVADNWKNSNLLIGAKRRIAGLHLQATDLDWSCGTGPTIAGPLQSLVLAMTGRKGAYGDLQGDGVEMLVARPE